MKAWTPSLNVVRKDGFKFEASLAAAAAGAMNFGVNTVALPVALAVAVAAQDMQRGAGACARHGSEE